MHQRTIKPRSVIATAAICLLSVATASAQSKQVMKPENQDITLRGIVRLIHGLGPPGYGEDPRHDAHVSYWALEVPTAINLPCTPDKPEDAKYECGSAKRINLFFESDGLKNLQDRQPAKWKNKRVLVKGKLRRADTAGEMTNIYMDAVDIQSASSATQAKP